MTSPACCRAPSGASSPPAASISRASRSSSRWRAARSRVFDPDLAHVDMNSAPRMEQLRVFLAGSRDARLRIVVHDAEAVRRGCPRLLSLLAQNAAAISIHETEGEARRAQDCFVIADGEHLVRRGVAAQPRGAIILHDQHGGPRDARPLRGDLALVGAGDLGEDARHLRAAALVERPPVEAVVLVGDADPVGRAAQRRARAPRARAPGVLFCSERCAATTCRRPRAVDAPRGSPRPRRCRRWPNAAADARLEPRRVRTRREHRRIVVALEHQRVAAARASPRRARVGAPVSVSTPSRRAPSESTYCTGSRASCGTGNGCTCRSPTANGCVAVDQRDAVAVGAFADAARQRRPACRASGRRAGRGAARTARRRRCGRRARG